MEMARSLSYCPVCEAPLRAVEWVRHTVACMRIEARASGLRPTVAEVAAAATGESAPNLGFRWPFG